MNVRSSTSYDSIPSSYGIGNTSGQNAYDGSSFNSTGALKPTAQEWTPSYVSSSANTSAKVKSAGNVSDYSYSSIPTNQPGSGYPQQGQYFTSSPRSIGQQSMSQPTTATTTAEEYYEYYSPQQQLPSSSQQQQYSPTKHLNPNKSGYY